MASLAWPGLRGGEGDGGGSPRSCPVAGPTPNALGIVDFGTPCEECKPEPPEPPPPPTWDPPVVDPPYDPPTVPDETLGSETVFLSVAAHGASPLGIYYSVSLQGVPLNARVYHARILYGYAPLSGTNHTGCAVVDNYGSGVAAGWIDWNQDGIAAINAKVGWGSILVLAVGTFACSPLSPCTASFGPVQLQVSYRIPASN